MFTSADVQARIVLEVGDTPDRLLATWVSSYWDQFSDKAAIFPRLQELYTKRALIDIRMGAISDQVSFTTDGALSLQLSQRTGYLKDRRAETQAEITRLETIARANRPSVIAPLINTELETPPPEGTPPVPDDANGPVYRGDVYWYNPGTGESSF